jgi:hypothetical protein
VFAASLMQAIADPIEVAIDLCAAPGGKSLCTWVMRQPQRLLCNEVIRKRVKILIANLKRCGAMEAIVLNQDPAILAEQLPNSAQLVLVDAPCSGQSLLAKGVDVPGCFHKVTLNRNANRQKRILANAAQLVQAKAICCTRPVPMPRRKMNRSASGFSNDFLTSKQSQLRQWQTFSPISPSRPAIAFGHSPGWGRGRLPCCFNAMKEAVNR